MSLASPVGALDHILGAATAPVTLVEYGDYQCPYCADACKSVNSVIRSMGPALRFVFRHMPLNEVHPYAQFAAEAAEAAGVQGKFWEMHQAIFDNQSELGSDLVSKLQRKLRLDIPRFEADLEARRFRARVKIDFMSGMRSGVAATPAFFINDERYEGSVHAPTLLAALRKRL